VRRGAEVGDPPDAAECEQRTAERADAARSEAPAQPRAGDRAGRGERGTWRDHQAGGERGALPDAGEEQHTGEQHRGKGGEEQHGGDCGEPELADGQQRRLDDRRGVARDASRDDGQQHDRQRQQPEHARPAPPPGFALHDRGDERADGDREHAGTEEVGGRRLGVAALVEDAHTGHERGEADGHVDEEDPAPAGLHEQAAERRAGRRGDPPDRRPRADRDVAALGRELRQQQAERGGHQERGAEPLHGPRGDQQPDRGRRSAGRGGGGEDRDAEQEGALAPERVRPAAGDDEEGRKDDCVGVEHPGEGPQAGAREVRADLREGDVDDEQVEPRHEHAGDDHAQHLPFALHLAPPFSVSL
jgi:hypothetical protein